MRIQKQDVRNRRIRTRLMPAIGFAAALVLVAGVMSVAGPGGASPVFAAAPITSLAFTPSPTTALVGQNVTFSTTATTPNTGAVITSFNFMFGDGASFTVTPAPGPTASASASHAYSVANTYLSSVTATDSQGGSGTANSSITVGGGGKLTVSATPNTTVAGVGQPVSFAIATTDPNTGASITQTTVNFGDGTGTVSVPAGQSSIVHPFALPGNFAVTATATDSSGATGTATTSILVNGAGIPVGANPYQYNGYVAPGSGYVAAANSVYNPVTGTYTPTTGAALTNGVSVSMAQGWSIVGGPSGTVITGSVGPLYTYQGADSQYEIVPAGSALAPGEGYWAFFGGPATDVIPLAPGQGTSMQIPASHFVMISNPGSGTATVSGVDYMVVFNTATNQYQATTSLGPGEGAWVWSWNGGTARIQSS